MARDQQGPDATFAGVLLALAFIFISLRHIQIGTQERRSSRKTPFGREGEGGMLKRDLKSYHPTSRILNNQREKSVQINAVSNTKGLPVIMARAILHH